MAMSPQVAMLLTAYVAQAVLAVVLAYMLVRFYTHYGRPYLEHWAWCWFALSVYEIGGGISFALSNDFAASHPLRLVASGTSQIAGYLQVAWLVFGASELTRRRPVRLAFQRNVLIFFAVVGVASTLVFAWNPAAANERFAMRVGARALFAAIAFGSSAFMVLRARRNRHELGLLIIGIAFSAYAVAEARYAAVAFLQLITGHSSPPAPYLGFVDLILQAVMGFGMLTCLLEDERHAATLASNEIEHLAYHDSLTGLPNRPLFIDRLFIALSMAERSKTKVAVLFCDIDRFKEINDSLGHSVGDELLRVIADRITSSVRAEDTVARFGGDEFTLIVQKIDRVDDAVKVAQKILEMVKIPQRIGEHELSVTTSIGVSLYPADGRDAETLVKNADTAMYRAKDAGRDNFQLYAPAMNARAVENLALENMLRKALTQQELVVYYQAIIDLQSGEIGGFEALIRWRHPELGLLSPAHFISTAEVSGLIVPLGEWVMRRACDHVRHWRRRTGRDLTVSVNLSARQFQQSNLVERVKEVLLDTGLEPHALHLEVTESNAMQNAENSAHTLRELKSVGVSISMDDFGTGYSSLSYLKRFPIDTIKLDRSFVKDLTLDPEDDAIATAILAMAHSLKLKVVAEGVETLEQLTFLEAQSCDAVQGFYFSEPVPAEVVEKLLTNGLTVSPFASRGEAPLS